MSLRLRIWLACLAGSLVSAAGLWWVMGTQIGPDAPDAARVVVLLLAAAGGGIAVGLVFALWLDRHVLAHLRGISRVVRGGDVQELRGLPSTAGWGELSDLTNDVQARVSRDRQLERAAAEGVAAREQLEEVRERMERWMRTEQWEPLGARPGPAAEVAEALDRAFTRDADVREQNFDAARQIRTAMSEARGDARESVEQAERGFVEATSLLTTVRELQRLSGEMQGAISAAGPAPVAGPAPPAPPDRSAAAAAIEELVQASVESVEHLAAGLVRVREIADQVQIISNRATLVALQSAVAGSRAEAPGAEAIAELKQLTRDVRVATDRTDLLSREVEREVGFAAERMRGVRERVAAKLEVLPAAAPAPAEAAEPAALPRSSEDALRLLERVREMVQDATRKGERLSSAGERASRAAERLARRLDEQTQEMEGLVVRLSRAGGALPDEPAHDEASGSGLRLLETDEGTGGTRREGERP